MELKKKSTQTSDCDSEEPKTFGSSIEMVSVQLTRSLDRKLHVCVVCVQSFILHNTCTFDTVAGSYKFADSVMSGTWREINKMTMILHCRVPTTLISIKLLVGNATPLNQSSFQVTPGVFYIQSILERNRYEYKGAPRKPSLIVLKAKQFGIKMSWFSLLCRVHSIMYRLL